MRTADTILALATAPSSPSHATRALIRCSGDAAPALIERCFDLNAHPAPRTITPARFRLSNAQSVPCQLITFAAPHSYTGQHAFELLLPSNRTLTDRVLDRLIAADPSARPATPGEFTARAYLTGKLTLTQAESVAAIISASTADELAAARDLLANTHAATTANWLDETATLLALVEAGIDFTDQEDVVPIPPPQLRARIEALLSELNAHVSTTKGSAHLTATPRVVLVGPPNAGKSTLFNALLNKPRAVTSPAAGTTRDVLIEPLHLAADIPGTPDIDLVDIAGLPPLPPSSPTSPATTNTDAAIEASMYAHAHDAIASASLLLYCDPTGTFPPPLPPSSPTSPTSSAHSTPPTLRIRTKADLPPISQLPNLVARASSPCTPVSPSPAADLAVCAIDSYHLPALKRAIADAITAAPAKPSALTVLPRHRRMLTAAADQLQSAHALITPSAHSLADPELIAAALRDALDALSELTGRVTPDDILGRIFSTFCVGK